MPQNILTEIEETIQRMTREGLKCLVVFDLDSTLFDVSPRLHKILLDFAEKEDSKKKYPEQIALFEKIQTHPTDWGISGALQRAGVKHHPEFQAAITQFWMESFFSNHYLSFDQPIEGAIDYVNAIALAGAEIAYLTGRDIERMGQGSEQVLRKWGLPLTSRAQLILKPHRSLDDAEYKTDWFLEAQKKSYEKIFFFENEPVILHKMNEKCPQVQCIFLETTHSGKAHPPDNLPRLINFIRVRHPQN